jgi:hypothetical protein
MFPPLPHFLRMLHGETKQHSRKKMGERAGVRGDFSSAVIYESPLIRPIGHLLPRGEEGHSNHVRNGDQRNNVSQCVPSNMALSSYV